MLAVRERGNGWYQPAKDEFAEEVAGDVAGEGDAEGFEGDTDAAARSWVIRIGDRGGGEAAQQVRAIELVPAVIAAGDEGGVDRVPRARAPAASALVKVARILVE
jgi:hypothetical protein